MCVLVKCVGQRLRLFLEAHKVDGHETVELGLVDNDTDGVRHTGAIMAWPAWHVA